ncbi:hypothetical protein BCR44DRAFT_1385486 [Catenaria anguillulae PL171]|uniref:HCP-like protein n=1 Tax=Catenaria anguillulae PL171 TaxID=765915 RepID=A0A1Y2I3U6_9FUNG|nr:hypothetical protein BCR44DRAFT_1385486 [Catenaria anguillulae PL171]
MYQQHQQPPHPGAATAAQNTSRPAVAVPQFSSQSSLVPPQHLDDDADSDIGQPPSQPFTLPPGTRPSPSDFDTISRHLSLGRTPAAHGAAPLHQHSAPPMPSADDVRAMQADTHIQNGIQLHERLQLTESTREFERAAHLGSATGMYLYGMALRSAWGVERDEKKAFEYLSRAADLALRQTSALQAGGGGGKGGSGAAAAGEEQRAAAARELTLAIYELGQSFRNGWGVKKCRRTGAHYLQIAANLGDPDAQVDCGLAYLNGDGVKRDKMMAAKYFRLASNAGIEFPGNSWIWKDKYNVTGVDKKVKGGAAAAPPAGK